MLLLEVINKIRYSLSEDYYNKRWGKFSIKVLGLLLMLACVIFLLIWLTCMIYKNLQAILIGVGVISCIITMVLSVLPKKNPAPEPTNNNFHYDAITLESTYKLIRSGICTVISEVGEIVKVKKPASYSQMDAPTHYDIVANVPIYHYLVPKQVGETVDMYDTLGIIQNAIEQKLNDHSLPGINQTVFFYNGQAYPALMVDAVHDHGNFIQIDVAVASEHYCSYREQRLYNSINPSSGQNPQDMDY